MTDQTDGWADLYGSLLYLHANLYLMLDTSSKYFFHLILILEGTCRSAKVFHIWHFIEQNSIVVVYFSL